MSETRIRGEQLRFVSTNTGSHILDTYLEAAEVGGRSLADLLGDVFDASDGSFRADLFEFRENPSTAGELQFRVGDYVDPNAGWVTMTSTDFAQFVTDCQAAQAAAEAAQTAAESAESTATTAASTATTQAGIATTQASNASSSASDAQTAQAAAEAAQAAAELAYDNFDDRYLGDKASDPTLDNDGNALRTGAQYWNTTINALKIYDGSSWTTISVATTADAVGVTPVGSITSTDAQAALAELDTDITSLSSSVSNVDNTSDANKPVSTAQQTALDAKVTGPASATNNALVQYDGTTGKLVKDGPTIGSGANQIVQRDASGRLTGDGSLLTNLPGGGGTFTATADGAIADGAPVIINGDGTISEAGTIATSTGTVEELTTTVYTSHALVKLTEDVLVYAAIGSNTIATWIGEVADNGITVTWTSSTSFTSDNPTDNIALVRLSDTRFGAGFSGTSSQFRFVTGDVDVGAGTISWSSAYSNSNSANGTLSLATFGDGTVCAGFGNGSSLFFFRIEIASDGTPSFKGSVSFGTTYAYCDLHSHPSGNVLAAARASTLYVTLVSLSTTASSLTAGTATGSNIVNTAQVLQPAIAMNGADEGVMVGRVSSGNDLLVFTFTYNGTTPTWINDTVETAIHVNYPKVTYHGDQKYAVTYSDVDNSDYLTYRLIDRNSSLAPTTSTGAVLNSEASVIESFTGNEPAEALGTGRVAVAFKGASNHAQAVVYRPYAETTTGLTVGLAAEAISDTSSGEVTTISGTNSSQSGLTAGSDYYVADDGTLTTTATSGRKIGTALSTTEIVVTALPKEQ
jgi:multidrug efflux pump subunit AcrA (membrane-fusion protein)